MRGVDTRALATILLFTTALFAAEAPVQGHLTLAETRRWRCATTPGSEPRATARTPPRPQSTRRAQHTTRPSTSRSRGWGPTTALWWRPGAITTSSVASRAATGIHRQPADHRFRTHGQPDPQRRDAGPGRLGECLGHARAGPAAGAPVLLSPTPEAVCAAGGAGNRRVAWARPGAATALQKSDLRSTLDVSFAAVNVSEAELLLFRAQNDIRAATAELSAAMGFETPQEFTLAEEALPPPLAGDAEALVRDALAWRGPSSSPCACRATPRSGWPTVRRACASRRWSLLGTAGVLPVHDEHLRGKYAGGGLNLSIPVFNGNLFAARHAEAELRAKSIGAEVKDLELRIAQSVRVAWLSARETPFSVSTSPRGCSIRPRRRRRSRRRATGSGSARSLS